MGVFENVRATIDVNINANGEQRITGKVLNGVLQEIVSASESSSSDLQESLSSLSEKVDNIGSKDFNPSGTYPDLTAGDLAGRGESIPAEFGFRASGGKSIKDGRAYIKRIKGNSVVWNNMAKTFQAQDCELSENGNLLTITPQGGFPGATTVAPMPFVIGHKYICVSYRLGGGRLMINCDGYDGDTNVVFTAQKGQNWAVIYDYGETEQFTITRPIIVDLTKMFGAGKEPTTIEEFQSRVATLGIDMYAYNEGQVIHCNTESIKSVGDNAWDEEWELGAYSSANGNKQNVTNYFRSKNRIKILPNTDYYFACPSSYSAYARFCFYDEQGNFINYVGSSAYLNKTFKTPSNAYYMVFWTGDSMTTPTYNNDIMISLVHSGWKQDTDAGYQPYWQDTLPLPIIRKYFPDGMKLAGTAHDEIRYNKASGKWEYSKGKIKSVDLGTLNWKNLNASNGMFYLNAQEVAALNMAKSTNTEAPTNLMSSLYRSAPTSEITNIDKVFRGPFTTAYSGYLTVKDTSYTDAASFKAEMAGVMLYYEAAEWEWVELDAEDQNFRDYYNVADFGTEQAIPATDAEGNIIPSAPFSADIIYQFNAVDMIREHEAEINELQDAIKAMQAQLASFTNL